MNGYSLLPPMKYGIRTDARDLRNSTENRNKFGKVEYSFHYSRLWLGPYYNRRNMKMCGKGPLLLALVRKY